MPDDKNGEPETGIILNTVSEYCRGLGEILKSDEAEAEEVSRKFCRVSSRI